MPARVYIESLVDHVDSDVVVKGWLYNKRSSGKIVFLELRDGTGRVQGVVVRGKVGDDVWDAAEETL